MEHNMILSASGWRKVFAESGDEQDLTPEIGKENTLLCALIAESFAQYLNLKFEHKELTIVVATDTRPTGKAIAESVIKSLIRSKIQVIYLGVASAPEIMVYAKKTDGFVYISASHNPVGHNGIKFGLSNGGVVDGAESKKIISIFENKCKDTEAQAHAQTILDAVDNAALNIIYDGSAAYKKESLAVYSGFIKEIITGTRNKDSQKLIFSSIKSYLAANPVTVVCDMNGSARSVSIDKDFVPSTGITFAPFNNEPGCIVHAIIPEPENLIYCADKITEMQTSGDTSAILGYMPDCDGDRGNIVYWDEKSKYAKPVVAQEVFALCAIAESAFDVWKMNNVINNGLYWQATDKYEKNAIAVNCPTSMRIDEICKAFGIELFRAEVGEANVVNLAEEKRSQSYNVRILGEGSNGGNITHPSKVRDPLASLYAILKLLTIRDNTNKDGTLNKGLFHIWCEKSGQENKYKDSYTLSDIIDTLPAYTTTGVSEPRAILKVKTQDKGLLKEKFKQIFEQEWQQKKDELASSYGFDSYEADITNGTKEVKNASDWNNANGGLKVRFLDKEKNTKAFIWMRPSGTEPVFRIMCDIKGNSDRTKEAEHELLKWETDMLLKADN